MYKIRFAFQEVLSPPPAPPAAQAEDEGAPVQGVQMNKAILTMQLRCQLWNQPARNHKSKCGFFDPGRPNHCACAWGWLACCNDTHLGARGRGWGGDIPACSGPTGDEGSQRRRSKQHPWEGVHQASGDRLHLARRQDREPIVVLFQGGKHILCAQVNACGVAADWQQGRPPRSELPSCKCVACVVLWSLTTWQVGGFNGFNGSV
jgi:hypothetical protein